MSRHAVFSTSASTSTPHDARVLVYGDSITAGFPEFVPYAKALVASCWKSGVAIEIVGCGACGLTSRNMAQHLCSKGFEDRCNRTCVGLQKLLEDESQDEGPFSVVLIMAGTNDVLGAETEDEGPSAKEILSDIQMLHRACRDRDTPTVALSIPGIGRELSTYQRDLRSWINEELRGWANGECTVGGVKPARFVDCDELLPNNSETVAQGAWEEDGVHFSEEGSALFGAALAPELLSVLGRTSSM